VDVTLTLPAFIALVLAVGALRLIELRVSQRRRRALARRGASPVAEPHFRAMVLVHTGILAGAIAEAVLLPRPPVPALSLAALALVIGANLLRWWVIATLGPHWNVGIMSSLSLGVVENGPFRFIRHPNYVAVFVELTALPLVHGAYVTAALGALAHLWVLYHRIRAEESVLLAAPAYRAVMATRPRFLPRVFDRAPASAPPAREPHGE
jgi:methyltransferase